MLVVHARLLFDPRQSTPSSEHMFLVLTCIFDQEHSNERG